MDITILGSIIIGGLAFFGVVIGKRLEIENHKKEVMSIKQREILNDVIDVLYSILDKVEQKKKDNDILTKDLRKKVKKIEAELLKYSSFKSVLLWNDFIDKNKGNDRYKHYGELVISLRSEMGLVNSSNIVYDFFIYLINKIFINEKLSSYDVLKIKENDIKKHIRKKKK